MSPNGRISRILRAAVTPQASLAVMALLLPSLAAMPGAAQAPQPPIKTVLDGVYTTGQAERGRQTYGARCAGCHRADLSGFSAPPLKGDRFMDRWREFNLDVLFNVIEMTMPLDSPKGLAKDTYLDVAAFLLQANGVPAGSRELTAAELTDTRLVGSDGPMPLPSSAPAVVAGCMTLDSGVGWFLTRATEPARTLDPFALTTPEVREAERQPLGALVLRLQLDIPGFTPAALVGRKVVAKGVLVRQAAGSRINVTALQAVSPTCEPSEANATNN